MVLFMTDDSRLDSLLKQMAEDHHPELPSPGLIWWRAQILRKQQEMDRIERPLIIMRWVAAAACSVVFVVVLAGNWKLIQASLGDNYPLFIVLGILMFAVSLVSAMLVLWSPGTKPW